MMTQQHFCFKWNNYQANMSEVFHNMLLNENMVDVTIACEGASIKAHKMVLAACSPFFQNLFMTNPCKHPIVILKDVRFIDLKATIDFMYKGEVNVSQDQVSSLLKTAETLRVKGLSDITEKQTRTGSSPQPVLFTKGKRRKRNRHKSSQSKEEGESECSSDSDEENKYRQAENNRQSLPRTLRAITYQKDKEQPIDQVNEQEENIDESQQLGLQQQSQTEEEQMEPSRILEQSIATAEVEEAENGQEDVVIASDVHVIPNDEGIKQVALYQESIDMSQSGNAQILSLPGTSVTTYKPPGPYSQQIVIKRQRSRIRTSAIERVRRFAEESFYEVSGTLFCRACGESVNHLKASVIKYHIRSQKHLANKIKMKSISF